MHLEEDKQAPHQVHPRRVARRRRGAQDELDELNIHATKEEGRRYQPRILRVPLRHVFHRLQTR